jgi:transposase
VPEIPTRLEALARLIGLSEENKRLKEMNAELAKTIDLLHVRIAALEARLAQNSTNSNRPPSSDSPQDRESRPDRRATGRTRGGQRGHKGLKRNLLPAEKVNETRECYPELCRRRGCGRRLRRHPFGEPLRHQVVDVPAIEPHVTEYRLHSVACDCGKITCAPLPDGVPRGMCGPRLMALIALLTGIYRNSRRDAVNVLSDVLGVRISLGALSEAEARVSEAVAAPVEEARTYVSEQGVKHVDATGWRQAGNGRTLWTIATALVTVFGITADGSRARLRGLFAAVRGILVTDRGTQFGFWAMQDRQICWAHLIRKFVSFAERSGPVGQLGADLLLLSRTMIHCWHKVRDGTMSRSAFGAMMVRMKPVVEGHLERGVQLRVRGVSGSCADILEHRLALWTFVDRDGVEPTNNAAERALRSFVLWRKMSFGSQSERGNRFAARIMTVAQTLRKQRRHVLAYLTDACQAALSDRTPPSLLPPMSTR